MIRIITEIPVSRLFLPGEEPAILIRRGLCAEGLKALMRISPFSFVLADVGLPLLQVKPEECYAFWKSELSSHLVDDVEEIRPESFIDGYCYAASLWKNTSGISFVLLEKHH